MIETLPIQAILHSAESYTAIAVFIATYLFIAVGKLPGYHLDRAGAALLGACLMVWLGVLTLDEAFAAIDFDTIALLLGMMIVVANLRLSGPAIRWFCFLPSCFSRECFLRSWSMTRSAW